ncbi:MAG TPA: HemK/PrmC family methyltransferase [Candidatus Paceibacterota bacterium]
MIKETQWPSSKPAKDADLLRGWLLQEKYHGVETPGYFADLKRIEGGEPLAYVIGWVDFLGCRINLSPRLPHRRGQVRPLIPRPETEFWVERAISQIQTNYHVLTDRLIHGSSRKDTHAQKRILDMFAGSGCMGIALLKHLPHVAVDFGEKNSVLCKQIEENIALNNIDSARTHVIQTDIFSGITGSYDFIFANPPYIDPIKKDTVQVSVLTHEPHDALFADDSGLCFIKKLLTEGGAHLKQKGVMYVEFGEDQKDHVAKLARDEGWKCEFYKDQFGVWRVARLTIS